MISSSHEARINDDVVPRGLTLYCRPAFVWSSGHPRGAHSFGRMHIQLICDWRLIAYRGNQMRVLIHTGQVGTGTIGFVVDDGILGIYLWDARVFAAWRLGTIRGGRWDGKAGFLVVARDIHRRLLQERVAARVRGLSTNRGTWLVRTWNWRVVVRDPDSLDLDASLKGPGAKRYLAGMGHDRMQLRFLLGLFALFCLGMLLGSPSAIDKDAERIDEYDSLASSVGGLVTWETTIL
jgi:hypothetical protein